MHPPSAGREPSERPRRTRWATALTTAACLLVCFALLAPNRLGDLSPAAFLRIPVEVLVAVALLLVLPLPAGRVLAVAAGSLLGLLLLLKALDWGFHQAFDRPFDLLSDWTFLGPSVDLLAGSIGHFAAVVVVVLGALAAVGLVLLMALAARRLARVVVGHRHRAARAAAALGLVWLVLAVTGLQVVPGKPVASTSGTAFAYDRVQRVRAGLHDQDVFARELAVDAFGDTPGSELLTGLRGKDVVIAFVESYGRFTVEDPQVAPKVDALLDAGTRRLRDAGLHARSAFLTSPTAGGGSWLAHSTLHSGLWIDNPLRYDTLLGGDRLTLASAFRRAGWRTVSVVPANTRPWPEGRFYRYHRFYTSNNLNYRGPRRDFAPVPDQYTLAAFQRRERGPGHRPVMAEIDLVTSHWPWEPAPPLLDWGKLGDGSVFADLPEPPDVPQKIDYRDTIRYSLSALISYARTYGGDDLVLIALGDHRPATMITGDNASRDVPITVITGDAGVLKRIDDWGWQPGLNPAPDAPTWRMDAFRDRFLTAYGPRGEGDE